MDGDKGTANNVGCSRHRVIAEASSIAQTTHPVLKGFFVILIAVVNRQTGFRAVRVCAAGGGKFSEPEQRWTLVD